MSDLVERLRRDFPSDPRIAGSPEMELRWKAADEIERLQKHHAEAQHKIGEYVDLTARLRAALERISKRARQKWSEGKEDGWLWIHKTADEALLEGDREG